PAVPTAPVPRCSRASPWTCGSARRSPPSPTPYPAPLALPAARQEQRDMQKRTPTARVGTLVRDAVTGEPIAQVWRESDGWHASRYDGRLPGTPRGPFESRDAALEAVGTRPVR